MYKFLCLSAVIASLVGCVETTVDVHSTLSIQLPEENVAAVWVWAEQDNAKIMSQPISDTKHKLDLLTAVETNI